MIGPYARFSLIYFLYLSGAAMVSTYWPYRMEALGMSRSMIGALFAGTTCVAVASQLALAWLSPRVQRPERWLAAFMAGTALFACAMPWVNGALWMAALFTLLIIPRSNTLPLADAITVDALGSEVYDRVRLWGTIGYGVSAGVLGLLTHRVSHAEAGWWATVAFAALMVVMTLTSAPHLLHRGALREAAPSHLSGRAPPDLKSLTRQPALAGLLAMGAFHWAGIMIFNIYTPLHLKELGHGNAIPGAVVAVAICAEVLGLFAARHLFRRAAAARWMPLIFILTAARWTATALATSIPALIAAQALHLISFGVWLAANMRLLGLFAPDDQRSGVQSLFFAVSFGLGGALGSALGGQVMEHHGGAATFLAAAALDLLALLTWALGFRGRLPQENATNN
ncbi:MAG: hypothetical protein CMH57_07900 [Myxococcales bacterium]|nr:hypothetical protein [Myxococcales bacterium]